MMNEELKQALEQLRERCEGLVDAGHARPWQLARAIDELNGAMTERFTTRPGNSAVGALQEGERCR